MYSQLEKLIPVLVVGSQFAPPLIETSTKDTKELVSEEVPLII